MEIEYLKSPARLLDRDQVNKRDLDLSKEVLWIAIGQRAEDLRAVKVGGQKRILPIGPRTGEADLNWPGQQNFFFIVQVILIDKMIPRRGRKDNSYDYIVFYDML